MVVPEVSVVFLTRTGAGGLEVLLGDRLTGFAKGRVGGVGGTRQNGETAARAAVRGVFDEIGVEVEACDLREAGVIEHHFPTRRAWSQRSTVFVCRRFTGEPAQTAVVAPRWYPLADLPFGRMRSDAARWLPGVLRGGSVDVRFTFGADLTTVVLEAS